MRKQPKPTTLPPIVSESLWTIENLAAYMQIAVATIYSDLTRAPHRVPPTLPRRGRTSLRWDPEQTRAWIRGEDGQSQSSQQMTAANPHPPRRSKRGRPTKAEAEARRKRSAEWPGDPCTD